MSLLQIKRVIYFAIFLLIFAIAAWIISVIIFYESFAWVILFWSALLTGGSLLFFALYMKAKKAGICFDSQDIAEIRNHSDGDYAYKAMIKRNLDEFLKELKPRERFWIIYPLERPALSFQICIFLCSQNDLSLFGDNNFPNLKIKKLQETIINFRIKIQSDQLTCIRYALGNLAPYRNLPDLKWEIENGWEKEVLNMITEIFSSLPLIWNFVQGTTKFNPFPYDQIYCLLEPWEDSLLSINGFKPMQLKEHRNVIVMLEIDMKKQITRFRSYRLILGKFCWV